VHVLATKRTLATESSCIQVNLSFYDVFKFWSPIIGQSFIFFRFVAQVRFRSSENPNYFRDFCLWLLLTRYRVRWVWKQCGLNFRCPHHDALIWWLCKKKKTLLPQQNVLLLWPQQNRIVVVTISIVTTTICIVTTTITVVTIASKIVTSTLVFCWGYINKTFCWGNKVIFSVVDQLKCDLIERNFMNQFVECVFCTCEATTFQEEKALKRRRDYRKSKFSALFHYIPK